MYYKSSDVFFLKLDQMESTFSIAAEFTTLTR